MKIAFVSSTFPPYEGGIGNACYNTAKQLAIRGHEVTVFLPTSLSRFEEMDAPFHVEYLHPIFTIGNASLLPSLWKRLANFDVIQLYYPFFGGDIFVSLASKWRSIPYFLSYQQDIYGDTLYKKLIFRIYNVLFQRFVILGARKILALSEDHIQHSQIQYVMHVPGKVEIVPNGCDVEKFAASHEDVDVRTQYDIDSRYPIIIFVGALDSAHYFKRLDILLEAIRRLSARVHLLVIGDGDLRATYEKMALSFGLQDRVTFLGKVPNQNVGTYVRQSDFLVLPSTDTESFGIVLIEAMACEKPVIASDLSGVRSTIQDGVSGFLFQKGSIDDLVKKMQIFLEDPHRMKEMGREGRRIVMEKYTWSRIAEHLEQIYFAELQEK